MLGEEFMKPLGISINGLALELHVPVTRISQIVNERRGITADTALRLARHFGTSPDFWMNIQKDYELLLTRRKSMKMIERQVRRRTVAASPTGPDRERLRASAADQEFSYWTAGTPATGKPTAPPP